MGFPSQEGHVTRVLAVIWGIILIIVIAGRWSKGGDLRYQAVWILVIRIVNGIWSMGRKNWRWGRGGDRDHGCCGVRSGCLVQFNGGRLTHVGSNTTTRDALPVLQKGHGEGSTRFGVVGENERCRGPGCGRSGACTVRSLHNGVEAEGEVSCGVRKDLASCIVRRRGCVLDHSAATILINQLKGLQGDICTYILRVVRHRDKLKLERRVASRGRGERQDRKLSGEY